MRFNLSGYYYFLSQINLFLFFFNMACGTSTGDSARRATEFAQRAGWDVKSIDCQEYDSDDNEYVSCSVFMRDGTVEALDCPAWDNCNNSCRVATAKQ